MKPHLGFIVMALVWSVPLASYAISYVRRAERQARRRIQIAVDQVNRDTPSYAVGHVSPLVPDGRAIRQFRSRSPGASRLVRLVTRGAQTLQALVPIR